MFWIPEVLGEGESLCSLESEFLMLSAVKLMQHAGEGTGEPLQDDKMAEMIGRLKLTAEESDALEVADDIEDGLATSKYAIIGKVLSQGVLHIQTILAALRPAWGNPKGLNARSIGDNLFIAEFVSRQDKDRVLDGSPWNVGNRAVLIQDFDANLRPSDIVFNHMSIWVRIKNLPLGLMNKHWGEELARKIGIMEKIDVDAQGRAWGAYLRVKVKIDITKPLRRGVSIFSAKRQAKEWYEIQYEKLPTYCYSCGVIGHSSVECPTPGERDENGLLPYSADLRVPDERKKKVFQDLSGHSSNSMEKLGNVSSGRNTGSRAPVFQHSNDQYQNSELSGQHNLESFTKNNVETKSPTESQNGRDQYLNSKIIAKTNSKSARGSGKVLMQEEELSASGQRRKRKQARKTREEECFDTKNMEMAIVLASPGSVPSFAHNYDDFSTEVEDQELAKKQKTDFTDEQAGLLNQSRLQK